MRAEKALANIHEIAIVEEICIFLFLSFKVQGLSKPTLFNIGRYFRDTVIRFLLRLLLISRFILVLIRPLVAGPKRVIFQSERFPRIICGLLVRM